MTNCSKRTVISTRNEEKSFQLTDLSFVEMTGKIKICHWERGELKMGEAKSVSNSEISCPSGQAGSTGMPGFSKSDRFA